jgi:PAS domain S-box-containing protein
MDGPGGQALFNPARTCHRLRRSRRQLNSQLAEQATILRDDKHRQEMMFAANPCPMWIFDCETLRFTAVNEAAIRIYGYSREEFLSMTLIDIRPEKDCAAFMERVKQPHSGYTDAGIWRHRRKDGSTILVDIKTFEFQANRRRQRLVVASDMTERCQMEEALRESEASLKQLVDNAPFGISQSFVEENRAKSINPAFRKILGGYSVEEVSQLNIAEQIYANAKDRDKLIEVLRRNRRVEGGKLPCAAGTEVWCRFASQVC